MTTELKQLFDDPERAVSPVIGVILMVAITVILAAVIGTFVLDLGSSTSQNPQAGVSFQEGSSATTVTLTSAPRADLSNSKGVIVEQGGNCDTDNSLNSIGDTVDCSGSGQIIVTAFYQGKSAVVATYSPS